VVAAELVGEGLADAGTPVAGGVVRCAAVFMVHPVMANMPASTATGARFRRERFNNPTMGQDNPELAETPDEDSGERADTERPFRGLGTVDPSADRRGVRTTT